MGVRGRGRGHTFLDLGLLELAVELRLQVSFFRGGELVDGFEHVVGGGGRGGGGEGGEGV